MAKAAVPARTVHLLCNAHLDPVWLWEWEEGAAEALSTFRCAADFCDEFPGFVFNHNEAVLYQWIEEYEPTLFRRIQKLVKQGRWKIIGGWYLQPDCNMPSGESFARQVLIGKRYFREKFGVDVTTAMNVDPFGHSRGLAQILARSGHRAYLFCRPMKDWLDLPGDDFRWIGYDGSEVIGHRTNNWYNSGLGKAAEKVQDWLNDHAKDDHGIILWGVGNHGGGPSRVDLRALAELQQTERKNDGGWNIVHASADAYFDGAAKRRASLPIVERDLNPWGVGCYTSQIRIKQGHRRLENELYAVEKMAIAASVQKLAVYPSAELSTAQRDLLFCEFHDILPGSSIQPVEDQALRILGHGLEELNRAKARMFFALASGQAKGAEGEIPVLVYNPHPYPIDATIEVEFQLQDQNWSDAWTLVTAYQGKRALPTQVEKELSNLSLDWRKRVLFRARLAPSQMNRFDCKLHRVPAKPVPGLPIDGNALSFSGDGFTVAIDTRTGLISSWQVAGVEMAKPDFGAALVMQDNEDPWSMATRSFRTLAGRFALLDAAAAARFCNVKHATLAPVRVIEDGPVRTVVEALFGYETSRLVLRWFLPKQGGEIGVEVRVHWNEKDRFLKLSLPTSLTNAHLRGQVAYGTDDLPSNGDEAVAQKWAAAVNATHAVTAINDGTYGCDFADGELRLSLLRSPAYSAHPINDRPMVPDERNTPRSDQGERLFRFWLNAGPLKPRLTAIDREALACNERPMALSFFPSGLGKTPAAGIELKGGNVLLTACKRAESGSDLIVRLFNPTATKQATTVLFSAIGLTHATELGRYEIQTLRVNPRTQAVKIVDLLERPMPSTPVKKLVKSTAKTKRT